MVPGVIALFDSDVTRLADNIVVVNLRKLNGGANAAVSRVPPARGVYAWFEAYDNLDPSLSGTAFSQRLVEMAERKHCLDRRGRIKPLYQVTLESMKTIPKNKKLSLSELCEDPNYRAEISSILTLSLLFQQPLYVGKAQDLRARISEHLDQTSKLRRRLELVGIKLENCFLLYATLRDDYESTIHSVELTTEDLLSRLFHPLFTERYG